MRFGTEDYCPEGVFDELVDAGVLNRRGFERELKRSLA